MGETLPSLLGLTVPSSPLLSPLLSYLRQHTSPSTVNHSIRSAYWSLLLGTRLPQFASAPPGAVNLELVVLASIMHDLGWATTKDLISADKRFEVDGANLAVKFITDHKDTLSAKHADAWSAHDLDTVWSAIALHTSPSIAHNHPRPEVALVQLGILADFFGHNLPPPFPPGLIKEEEVYEVIKAYPREGFKDEMVQIFCGICRTKPETTFDNWQSEFGITWGLDTKGAGKEEFKKRVEEAGIVSKLIPALEACAEIEPEDKLSQPREGREKYWYEAE